MPVRVPVDRDAIATFCNKHGIRELSVFGSALRDDFRPDSSDVDVLVEFNPEAKVSLLGFCGMIRELEELFGRKVDLITTNSLSPYIRDRVLASREVLYVGEG